MLVHFPVAFWTVAAGVYVAAAAGVDERAIGIAKLANLAGLIMAIPAMAAGFLELRVIGGDGEATRVATWHMMVMATVWVCFLLALLLPMSTEPNMDQRTVQLAATASAGIGFALMIVGGWLGGRLVYELGVGVRDRTKS